MRTEFQIKLQHFIAAQFTIITALLVLSISGYLFTHVTGHDYVLGFLRLIDIGEASIPTYWSTFNLLLASILLFIIYKHEKLMNHNMARYWLLLSLGFLYLSIDEGASIHENFQNLHRYLEIIPPIFGTYSWVPFGILFTLIVGISFISFIKSLSRITATYFVIAGTVFISGAIGFDFLADVMVHTKFAKPGDLVYQFRGVLEEGFEMYGIALFNCALIREIISRDLMASVKFYREGVNQQ